MKAQLRRENTPRRDRARVAVHQRHLVQCRQELDGGGDLCVAARRGVSVAPFKAQNISNNSYPCVAEGDGRAQVAQAEACGLEPEPSMNPVPKPEQQWVDQVVVNGRVWKTLAGARATRTPQLRQVVLTPTGTLQPVRRDRDRRRRGVSELNLREHDLVNYGWSALKRRGCSSPTSSAAGCSGR